MKTTLSLLLLLAGSLRAAVYHAPLDGPVGNPVAVIDLMTASGAQQAMAQWETKMSTETVWSKIAAEGLEDRRGPGAMSFQEYRTRVVIPERVGSQATQGLTVVFEIVVDDYAEVLIDGRQPLVLGQTGGSLIKGFNAPNRVVLTSRARSGQAFDVEVFAANGPLARPPSNRIWVRSATLDFLKPDAPVREGDLEQLADGFQFTEGPVWNRDGGYLLFSDPNANTIYRYDPAGGVYIYRAKSGYTGADIGTYHQPGSNGLAYDADDRLLVNQHGNRRVIRLEKNGRVTVVADRFEGKRLNSPNDLVVKSDGWVYFTDPPFGLPKGFQDPQKELPFSGVFRARDGRVELLSTDLSGPNGIAFSPDEKFLYVSNWDPQKKWLMRYPVKVDGTLAKGRVFFDMSDVPGDDALDGIKVDVNGQIYAVGPGGIWVISPKGKLVRKITAPEHIANLAWGDDDGRSLYVTASSGLYRIRVQTPGRLSGRL